MEINTTDPKSLPLVSIIIPVFNGEKYLEENLDSIVAQTYPNIEILVMNDASTDGTSDIIASYGNKVTHYKNEKNLGQFENVNLGIEITKGEFVCVYHSDDIYLPTIVEKEVTFLRQYPDSGAVFCADMFIDKHGKEYGKLELPPEVRGGKPLDFKTVINAELTYKNIFLVCPTCMVRKSVYADVGVYNQQRYKNSSDFEMFLRIARSYNIGILEDYLLLYRHGHGSSSQTYHHLRTDLQRFFMIMDDFLDAGALEVAEKKPLMYYKSHRHQENVMCAISAYIKKDIPLCRNLLKNTSSIQLLKSDKIQRFRMIILMHVLLVLSHAPHSTLMANIFYNRWHNKS